MFAQHREGYGSIKISCAGDHVSNSDIRDNPDISSSSINSNEQHALIRRGLKGDNDYSKKENCDGNLSKNSQNSVRFRAGEVVSMHHSYPFRFLVPENASDGNCCWIYPVTFGGGLVAGDQISADYEIGDHCAAVISSQESSKIYHCLKGEQTVQTSTYWCGDCSLLCVLPDPILCYKDANFSQKQIINLMSSSNLVFLDWMLSGRIALDESWVFKRYCNTIEIIIEDELVLRECMDLEDTTLTCVADSMGQYQVLGTCIILGNYLIDISQTFLKYYGRKRDFGEQSQPGLVVSVSQVSYQVKDHGISGCYLRFMAIDMKTASTVIHDIIQPLLPILRADPFDKKL